MSAARLTLIAGVMVSFVLLISGLVLQQMPGFDSRSLLEAGIIILLGTPVARVLILAIGLMRARETSFALVAFCILLLLSVSVAIGLRGE